MTTATPDAVVNYCTIRDLGCGHIQITTGSVTVRTCNELTEQRAERCQTADMTRRDKLQTLLDDQSPLVNKLVAAFRPDSKESFSEWQQAATIGMVEAVEVFTPNKSNWSSFVWQYMKKKVLFEVRATEGSQLTDYEYRIRGHLHKAIRAGIKDEAEQDSYIRERMGKNISDDALARVRRDPRIGYLCSCHSIPCECGAAAGSPAENTDPGDTAIQRVTLGELRQELATGMSTLTPQQAQLLVLLFGLDGGQPQTVSQIAATWGVSVQRASTVRKQALQKLRDAGGSLRHYYSDN